MKKNRCTWAGSDPLMMEYHDREWGVPLYDDRKIYEFLVLEGMQAGLSWSTILRKRENFRRAFQGFDPQTVARFGKREIDRLLQDASIIRNKMKIESAIHNARLFLAVQQEFGTFSQYIWGFVNHKPILNRFKSMKDLPASTLQSDIISKDLKQRGFNFVGSTIVYAHMQATGMVNDHLTSCFRYHEVSLQGAPQAPWSAARSAALPNEH